MVDEEIHHFVLKIELYFFRKTGTRYEQSVAFTARVKYHLWSTMEIGEYFITPEYTWYELVWSTIFPPQENAGFFSG